MRNPKNDRKVQIIFGICLILIGILIAFLLIKSHYEECAYRWLSGEDGFNYKYESVWDCFLSRGKGTILVSVALGLIPVGYGIKLCSGRRLN